MRRESGVRWKTERTSSRCLQFQNDRDLRARARQALRDGCIDDAVAHVVADRMGVIADRSAGTRIETDDASRPEFFLILLVSAIAEIEPRRGVLLLGDEPAEGNASFRAPPFDEHRDRRSFDPLVGLAI